MSCSAASPSRSDRMTTAAAIAALTAQPEGCFCNLCPLRVDGVGGPVSGYGPPDAAVRVVAEAPGEHEIEEGIPLVGASGQWLDRVMSRYRLPLRSVYRTNTLLCRPPKGYSLADYLRKVVHKQGLNDPLACCRPRLLQELQGATAVISLGGAALGALSGLKVVDTKAGKGHKSTGAGILTWRGSPLRVVIPPPTIPEEFLRPQPGTPPAADGACRRAQGEAWLLPTLHPAHFLREGPGRAWEQIVQHDLAKFCRIIRDDATNWDESHAVPIADEEELIDAMDRATRSRGIAVDIETSGGHSLETEIWCVGFAFKNSENQDEAWVVPFKTIQGDDWTYSTPEMRDATMAGLLAMLACPRPKVFHNGLYDVPILERHGFPVRGQIHDTMLLHHVGFSEWPHALAFLGSYYTDGRYWKGDIKEGANFVPASQHVYHLYNCRDTLVTLRSFRGLSMETKVKEQFNVYKHDLQLMSLAREMHERGMLINQPLMFSFRDELLKREAACRQEMVALLAKTDYEHRRGKALEDFSPSGSLDIRSALIAMGIPITKYTPSGLLCTDKDTVALAAPHATPDGRKFIRLLTYNQDKDAVKWDDLGFRAAMKLRTTYMERGRGKDREAGPPILFDGRLHADWKIHGTISGRFSSSPNMQNWSKWLRKAVVAPQGYKIVGADAAQLELRIQAHLSNDDALLAAFTTTDPHSYNAALIFDLPYTPDFKKLHKRERDLAKRYIYALAYGSSDENIWERLLPDYPGLQLASVIAVGKKIKQKYPRWMEWRERLLRETRLRGYAASALLGRRRYFVAGLVSTEILNFPIQSTAADIINLAAIKLHGIKTADTGWDVHLMGQVHDWLGYEVREDQAEAWGQVMAEVMPGPHLIGGVTRDYPVDVAIADNWKDA